MNKKHLFFLCGLIATCAILGILATKDDGPRSASSVLIVEGYGLSYMGHEYEKASSVEQRERIVAKSGRLQTFHDEGRIIHWVQSDSGECGPDLDKLVEMPAFDGSPIGWIRQLVDRSGVKIRTFGKKFLVVSATLELPESYLDFDSTIHLESKTATVREHIARSIPSSYDAYALNLYLEGGAITLKFTGMPVHLLENAEQRKLEHNLLMKDFYVPEKREPFYQKYSYSMVSKFQS